MKRITHLLLLMLMLSCGTVYATHIRGGNITFRRIDPQRPTYEITISGYADTESPVLFGSNAILDYGDGTVEQINNQGDSGWIPREKVGPNTWKYNLVRTHTYPGQKNYQISFRELYRNEGVVNMTNSVNMPFYIESLLIVSDEFINNSIELRGIPLFISQLNQTFHFNPQAFDIDGDSLSYHLTIPKQDKHLAVSNYRLPHKTFPSNGTSATGEAPYFMMNPISGDLIWDSPNTRGEYNYAFEVLEWRKINGKYRVIGKVGQDMQLIVDDYYDQFPVPQLAFPVPQQEVQIDQGSKWNLTIEASADNPQDSVVLLLSGDFLRKGAVISPSDTTGSKGKASITLQYTHGEEVNERYQLIAVSYMYYPDGLYGGGNSPFTSPPINRSVFLSASYDGPAPGEETLPLTNGIKEQKVKTLAVYPNPSPYNSFFIEDETLNGKGISVSLFTQDGRIVYYEEIPVFSTKKAILTKKDLSEGYYLLVIREGRQVFTSRILFSR